MQLIMLEIIEKIPETGSFSRSTDAMNAIRVMKGHKNVVIMLSKGFLQLILFFTPRLILPWTQWPMTPTAMRWRKDATK